MRMRQVIPELNEVELSEGVVELNRELVKLGIDHIS